MTIIHTPMEVKSLQVDTLAVYWEARAESAGACAQRCSAYLGYMAEQHVPLTAWYEKGPNKKRASSGLSINALSFDDLVALVAKGTNKRDVGGQVMEELGFRISLWNRLPGEKAIGLGIKCGLFAKIPGLMNAVVMQLPGDLTSVGLNPDQLKHLLVLTAETWDADWGAVFSSNSDFLLSRQGGAPFFDEILWLRDGYAPSPDGSGVIAETTGKGMLFVKR